MSHLGEQQGPSYESRFVAFLDILGWKDIVQHSTRDAALLSTMVSALQIAYTPDRWPGGEPEHGLRASQFSDSIVLSMSATYGGPEMDDSFHEKVAIFCHNMLAHGMFARGAITLGAMYHRKDIAFGPALVEAVECEKRAIYPRIIVPDTMADGRFLSVSPSGDGETIFDFLNHPFISAHDRAGLIRRYNRYGQIIADKLRQFPRSEDGRIEHIRRKYVWFAEYFNDVIARHRDRYPEILTVGIR